MAADIFVGFFGYNDQSEEKTSMGGGRILAMTSNRRQDYHQAQWQLAQHFSQFLAGHFELCGPIIVAAATNVIESEHLPRSTESAISYVIDGVERKVLVDYSAIWDSSGVRGEALDIADLYFRKLEELAQSSSSVELARKTATDFLRDAQYAYFLRKILIVAGKTGPALVDVVYPLLCSPTALWSYDLSSLIGEALRTNYSALDRARREAIESAILNLTEREEGERLEAMEQIRDRLLGCIPIDELILPLSLHRVACGALWTVSKGIQKGDIVLCPNGSGQYHVGEVSGEYSYEPGQILFHRRPVQWLKVTIDRAAMSEALRHSTGSIGTVSSITQYAEEIETLLGGATAPKLISTDETVEDASAFALESHLEDFLVHNWAQTELGKEYEIYENDGEKGQQYQTDTGPLDILAISKDKKRLLVVELKKGRASDAVVGHRRHAAHPSAQA